MMVVLLDAGLSLLALIGAAGEVAGPARPAASKTTPTEQSIALYKEMYTPHRPAPCPPGKAGEVVVCGTGRGGSVERIPLPDERAPPDWARRPTGEVPSAASAMADAARYCNGDGCDIGGPISLLKAPLVAVRIVHGLIDPEWASDQSDSARVDKARTAKK